MTWNYLNEIRGETADSVPDEWVWERLRNKRNYMLAACDWTQTADSPVDRIAWAAYRQALRDLPSTTTDPRVAVWPEVPSA